MTKAKTAAPQKVPATKAKTSVKASESASKAVSKTTVSPKKAAAKKAVAKPLSAARKKAPAPKKTPAAKASKKKAALKTAVRKTESVKKPSATPKAAPAKTWQGSPAATLRALKAVTQALVDKKASDLRILHLGHRSSITDFIVVATGLADTHLRALHIEAEKAFDLAGYPVIGSDRRTESGWVVVDAADIMVHIFTQEQRSHYALEANWKDAEIVDPAQLG